MRIVNFDNAGTPTLGVRRADTVVDLSVAAPDLPGTPRALLAAGPLHAVRLFSRRTSVLRPWAWTRIRLASCSALSWRSSVAVAENIVLSPNGPEFPRGAGRRVQGAARQMPERTSKGPVCEDGV